MPFSLSADKINENWARLLDVIESSFSGSRQEKLLELYDKYETVMAFLPASSYAHFHNAFPGGYVDYVLRTMDYAFELFKFYEKLGLYTENFTKGELLFVALNHDIGKVGFPDAGKAGYIEEQSDWHREHQNRMYRMNPDIPFAKTHHRSLYILQRESITMSWNEFQGILLNDGLFEKENRTYFINLYQENKLKCNLPRIIHQAGILAHQYEWERWVKSKDEGVLDRIDEEVSGDSVDVKNDDKIDIDNFDFDDFF